MKTGKKKLSTSWQNSSTWYKKIVGDEGHYYHQHTVLPHILRYLKTGGTRQLVDLASGDGILGRTVGQDIIYTGVDISPSLIAKAKRLDTNTNHNYIVADATGPIPLPPASFDTAAILLALQNISKPFAVVRNAFKLLKPGGRLLLVLNHPFCRIPQSSSWEVDEIKNIQYRRVDSYMTPKVIKIKTHPGKADSPVTYSFHYPLSSYCEFLTDNGFFIAHLEEWVSDKKSTGKFAKREDLSRKEFPMFLMIEARKDKV